MITRRHLSAVLLFFLASAGQAQTVDLDHLWLPQSYLRYLPRLYDAAQLVDASSRCAEFITGTVAVDRSHLDHPVFTFTCRDHHRQTYSLLVDGLTLHKIDDTRPEGFITFDDLELEYQREQALAEKRQQYREEVAQKRLQREYERQEQKRAERLWPVCWEPLQKRVGRMADLEWLTDTMPAPGYADTHDIDDSGVDERPPMVFVIDFNARDIAGQALQYRAHCTVRNADEYQLDIKPRRTEPSRQ